MCLISYLVGFTSVCVTCWIHCQSLVTGAGKHAKGEATKKIPDFFVKVCLCVGVILRCSCSCSAIVDQRHQDLVH